MAGVALNKGICSDKKIYPRLEENTCIPGLTRVSFGLRFLRIGLVKREFALLSGVLACLLLCLACDTYCISDREQLWAPVDNEYRLELTNLSPYMVEVSVDGESLGVYCSGVEKLPVGIFEQGDCSRIEAVFMDNPERIELDDCDIKSQEECSDNNLDGNTCYDTRGVTSVEARLE